MKDLVNGNLIIDQFMPGEDDRRSPLYFKKFIKYNSEQNLVELEDYLGNKTTVLSDFVLPIIRIPEVLLLQLGFTRYTEEVGVFFNNSVRLKKIGGIQYIINYPGKPQRQISCLYELQNLFKDYTGDDLEIFDFNEWTEFDFRL